MTLILVVSNKDQMIQIADRRLCVGNEVISDEASKCALFTCADGRFTVGFSGLAGSKYGTFDTQRWILESLAESGPPDYAIHGTVSRLTDKATEDFQNIPILRNLEKEDKRLSIVISGFVDAYAPPRFHFFLITNFQDWNIKRDSDECWGEFRYGYWREVVNKGESLDDISFVQRIGAWCAWQRDDELLLRSLLEQRKPQRALRTIGCNLVRDIAKRNKSRNMIGPQLMVLSIAREDNGYLDFHYDTTVPTNVWPWPDWVEVQQSRGAIFGGMSVERQFEDAHMPQRPMLVPRQRPDYICPCGSGRRYKDCHGVRPKGR